VVAGVVLSGCASRGGGEDRATEAEWRALATARPAPLQRAARLSITGVELAEPLSSAGTRAVSADLAVEELVATGLLRRQDVHFVERRRFAAAAAAERGRAARPPGAPPAGVSPGAELVATAVWLPLTSSRSTVEVRIADAVTGAIRATARVELAARPALLPLARGIVDAVREGLADLGRLPPWEDPIAEAGGSTDGTDVSEDAVLAFLQGLAAEERWSWEEARRGYRAAAEASGFYEAEAALARAARLRLGGTLGAS